MHRGVIVRKANGLGATKPAVDVGEQARLARYKHAVRLRACGVGAPEVLCVQLCGEFGNALRNCAVAELPQSQRTTGQKLLHAPAGKLAVEPGPHL